MPPSCNAYIFSFLLVHAGLSSENQVRKAVLLLNQIRCFAVY